VYNAVNENAEPQIWGILLSIFVMVSLMILIANTVTDFIYTCRVKKANDDKAALKTTSSAASSTSTVAPADSE